MPQTPVPCDDQTESCPQSSWLRFGRYPLALSLGLLVVDQASKLYVCRNWEIGSHHQTVIPGLFDLVHVRNTGAAWGMFGNHTFLLGVLSLVVGAVLVWRFRAFAEGSVVRAISLSMILGGILGNLVDRFWRGEVVDFLLFYYRGFAWPAFNVADSAITCGVTLYIISSLFAKNAAEPSCDAQPQTPGAES
jgi:signal peptidase II